MSSAQQLNAPMRYEELTYVMLLLLTRFCQTHLSSFKLIPHRIVLSQSQLSPNKYQDSVKSTQEYFLILLASSKYTLVLRTEWMLQAHAAFQSTYDLHISRITHISTTLFLIFLSMLWESIAFIQPLSQSLYLFIWEKT